MILDINTWYIVDGKIIGIYNHDVVIYNDDRLKGIIKEECTINAINLIRIMDNSYKLEAHEPDGANEKGRFVVYSKENEITKIHTFRYTLSVPQYVHKLIQQLTTLPHSSVDVSEHYRLLLEHRIHGIDAYRSSIKHIAYVSGNYLYVGSSAFIDIFKLEDIYDTTTLYPSKLALMLSHSDLEESEVFHHNNEENNQVTIIIKHKTYTLFIKDVLVNSVQLEYQQSIEMFFREIISQDNIPIFEIDSNNYKILGKELNKQDIIRIYKNGNIHGVNFKDNMIELQTKIEITENVELRDYSMFTYKPANKTIVRLYKYVNNANKTVAILKFDDNQYILSSKIT